MVFRHASVFVVAGIAGLLAACGLGDAAAPDLGGGTTDTTNTGASSSSSGGSSGMDMPPDADCPTGVACKSIPLAANPHAIRLTHEQWENTTKDLLRLDAPSGLSTQFKRDAAPAADAYGPDDGSFVVQDSVLWEQYRFAAESLASLVTEDATRLDKILPADAKPGAQGGDVQLRFRAFATDFLRRAWRRDPLPAEIDRVMTFGDTITATDTSPDPFIVRVKWLMTETLQSPYFLYRIEAGVDGPAVNGRVKLTPREVASRLSFVLWRTMPDDALIQDATDGKLSTPQGVATVAKRMLADPRAASTILAFHDQLFGVNAYPAAVRQTSVYPLYYPRFAGDAIEDVHATLKKLIIDGSGGVKDLYTSDVAFVNARLAPIYGIPADGLQEEVYVEKKMDPKRTGILAHVGWLAWQGHQKDPASITRGAYVARHVLCIELGSPPKEAMGKDPSQFNGKTNRERIEQMTTCGPGCHGKTINPLGFAFENFDSLGMFRTEDSGNPIDSTGGIAELGAFKSVPELMKEAVDAPRTHGCYAAHWAAFLSGQTKIDVKSDWLAPILTHSKNGASVRDIIVDLVQTDLFLTVSR